MKISKFCAKCKLDQPITNFRKDQYNGSGTNSLCNTCYNKNSKYYYGNNLDKVRLYAREWYEKNKDSILARRKAKRLGQSNPLPKKISTTYINREGWKRQKEKHWASRGIKNFTYSQYEQMISDQNNKCYLCNNTFTSNKNCHVDHSHITGKVRRILCNNCNNGMGKLKDNIELLRKAINYLEKYGE